MKVADYIGEFLYAQGVRHVFEVSGGMIAHILDAIHRQDKIKLISVHHEQAAAFCADAISRASGVPGVALATSGPGAINLLTGIGSCYFDSTASVFITGQVNSNELKGERPIRQLGFQEADIISMAVPITKKAFAVKSAQEVKHVLEEAFRIAISGRPGPVLIDIPMDVQSMQIDAPLPVMKIEPATMVAPDAAMIETLVQDLCAAKRPLILAGGGIKSGHAVQLFRRLLHKLKIPTVTSLMAVDVLAHNHPLRAGMIGTYGNRWANMALDRSDLLLVIGSRLDIRQTGANVDSFRCGRVIWHVDTESGEMNNRVTGCKPIHAHVKTFLESLLQLENQAWPQTDQWMEEIADLKSKYPDTSELSEVPGINPNDFMHRLSKASFSASAFVTDTGQHQMWACQSLELGENQKLITSGGMGAMGFGLPAAVGAALAAPGKAVVAIAGDGGFQMNIQELQTVVRNQLPIKIVLLDNGCHGMVRQFQESYYDKRYQSSLWGYSTPDFRALAKAYGIESCVISSSSEVESGVEQLWQNKNASFLLQVMIYQSANVYPKMAFGKPISEMEPLAKPLPLSVSGVS